MFKIIFSWKVNCPSSHTAPKSGGLMPYAAGHRTEIKGKIVQSARRLFNRHGFDNVSIAQIMAGAGLTHGGFFTDPNWKSCWEGVEVDLASADVGPQVVRAYLSRQHFEDVENSCPMVALPTDVSRSSPHAKRAFETVFEAMVSVLERSSVENGRPRRARAQATAALCVGGMVVARAILNRVRADELRQACMSVALTLGGWHDESKLQNGKSKRSHRLRAEKV
jgi:TetR/AcrR family transcriptional repressor of nem operon